jgi:hypothetical protein
LEKVDISLKKGDLSDWRGVLIDLIAKKIPVAGATGILQNERV